MEEGARYIINLLCAHDILEIRRGNDSNAPQAERTPFGWAVVRVISNKYRLNSSRRQRHVNFVCKRHLNKDIMEALGRLWTTESMSIKTDAKPPVGP